MGIDTNPTGANEESRDQTMKVGIPLVINVPATPPQYTTNVTVTAGDVLGGIITCVGAAFTLTLPAAADLVHAIPNGVRVGDVIDVLIYNNSANVTLATTTGATLVTSAKTALTSTGSPYGIALRFTNGTPGSEAYTIYS